MPCWVSEAWSALGLHRSPARGSDHRLLTDKDTTSWEVLAYSGSF